MNKHEFNWYADLGDGNYQNPILYTDYSDPDAIRVGDDYFMTASTFCNTPGLPILHSKDLVNWKVINYALKNIPYERYKTPQHGCGVWAPAIRYHDGEFIIFFPMPDEGIFVTKAKDPWGEWSEPYAIYEGKGWIDPCPFWDDDGKAYMVSAFAKSRIGFKSILNLAEMKPDCSALIDEGKHIFDGNINNQVTIEGPKMYKRNGYYYIFAPAGGVKPGWQVVLRSKNIWGPYEYKNVLVQGNTPINGPHQGAWLDTQTGEEYFIHFQDVYAAGRIVHMQPMKWVNDWPIIGEQINEDAGQPVLIHKKPNIGEAAEAKLKEFIKAEASKLMPNNCTESSSMSNNEIMTGIYAPDASDEFNGSSLGLQWQWNSNHEDSWYEMTDKGIKLFAINKDKNTSIANTSNILLQKWIAPEFTAVTKVNLANLTDGNITGMMSMGISYGAVTVARENGKLVVKSITGVQKFDKEQAFSEDNIKFLESVTSEVVYFKNRVVRLESIEPGVPREMIYLEYSLDGEHYKEACSFEAQAGRWVGVKNGIFCCNEGGFTNGNAVFEYFRINNKF